MGLIFKNNISPFTIIGIWEVDETPENFFSDELNSVKSESRKKEIVATKFLLSELCCINATIGHTENGKPYLKNSRQNISISHSYKYVALILEKRYETGIDIQKITAKITRIKEKFMSNEELKSLTGGESPIEKLHVYWGAKECVFKSYVKGNLIFSENIFIEPFNYQNTGEIFAHLKLPDEKKTFTLHYEKRDAYMLVYITDLINIVK